jgi:hypothetical protein
MVKKSFQTMQRRYRIVETEPQLPWAIEFRVRSVRTSRVAVSMRHESQRQIAELVDERRISERVRVLLAGEAVVGTEAKRYPLFVRDMSETGARLWSDAVQLPRRFVLRLPSQSLDIACTVVWRDGLECGVHFDGAT